MWNVANTWLHSRLIIFIIISGTAIDQMEATESMKCVNK